MKNDVESQMVKMLGTDFLVNIPTIANHAKQASNSMTLKAAANELEEKVEVKSVDFFYHKENNTVEAIVWILSMVQLEYMVVQIELLQNDVCIGKNTVAIPKQDTMIVAVHGNPTGNTVSPDDIQVRVHVLEKARSNDISAWENNFGVSTVNSFDECIDHIDILDPVNKKTSPGSTINVSYNRNYQLQSMVDYDYTQYWSGTHSDQEVYLDMKGSISLKSGYSYIENSFRTERIFLRRGLEFVEYKNEEAPKIETTADNIITYTYNNKWNSTFSRSVLGASMRANYRLAASLRCREEASGREITTMIVVSSEDYNNLSSTDSGFSSFKKIPHIFFYWGCVEENTLITMADGSQKKIKDFQPGEEVKSINGNFCRIADIMKGEEDSLISITATGKTPILVTKDHPFMTKQGEKAALLLDAEDEILLEDGTYAAIEEAYLSEKKYNVCSFVLEPEGFFYGNGYAIGDWAAQGRGVKMLEETYDFAIPNEIIEECEKINQTMNQK